ncbi:MAG TPA: hypothetical protein VFW26_07405, partial [Gaiellales bacterium]|nr:hypothetical protein [Gaiellales bacterium]
MIDISREPGRCDRFEVNDRWGGYGCEPSPRGVLGRANIPDIDAPSIRDLRDRRSLMIGASRSDLHLRETRL